ncbi:hypothetical protein PIIN_01179 [Serendipita indica DSM 11827]|uniref:DUF6533 domain-containing protein n=1 Tax=Serendipita indica (strain DSM 11827) TaxID=1109443 RepID=G4T7N3_SERID|nr:hypothetical protein PIIN_01179 [Serendipita indica DSM 11827]
MGVESIVTPSLIQTFANLDASRYTCGAAMTAMFYDYFLTFSEEVKCVWEDRRLSIPRLMFFWNRYFVWPWIILSNYRASLPSSTLIQCLSGQFRHCKPSWATFGQDRQFCQFVVPAVAVVQGISMVIGIQLFAMRVLALYRNDIKIKRLVYCWLVACHIPLIIIAILEIKEITPTLFYLAFTHTCYAVPSKFIKYGYVPAIIAEGGLLALQTFHHVRNRRHRQFISMPLVDTLYRDGYIWFCAAIGIRLFAVLVFAFADPSLWHVANQMDFPLSSALASRFYLQLKSAIQPELEAISDFPTTSPHFSSPRAQGTFATTGSQFQTEHSESIPTSMPLQELRKIRAPR